MSMEKATRSVSGDDESAPVLANKKRYHDLDALRGFAMLLGIVIHGLMSFMPIPLPGFPQDINQNPEVFGYVFNFIHGFRMQLFFLISGFFTAMLWRKQGACAPSSAVAPVLVLIALSAPAFRSASTISG